MVYAHHTSSGSAFVFGPAMCTGLAKTPVTGCWEESVTELGAGWISNFKNVVAEKKNTESAHVGWASTATPQRKATRSTKISEKKPGPASVVKKAAEVDKLSDDGGEGDAQEFTGAAKSKTELALEAELGRLQAAQAEKGRNKQAREARVKALKEKIDRLEVDNNGEEDDEEGEKLRVFYEKEEQQRQRNKRKRQKTQRARRGKAASEDGGMEGGKAPIAQIGGKAGRSAADDDDDYDEEGVPGEYTAPRQPRPRGKGSQASRHSERKISPSSSSEEDPLEQQRGFRRSTGRAADRVVAAQYAHVLTMSYRAQIREREFAERRLSDQLHDSDRAQAKLLFR